MSFSKGSIAHRLLSSDCGQAVALIAAVLALLLASAAFAIDMGNLYWSYQELLAATQAAAKAAGGAMPNPNASSATSVAQQYSGQSSSDYNYRANLNVTSVSVNYACVSTTTYTALQLPPCVEFANACPTSACNAVQVTEQATVQTFFAKVFGVNTLNISATATASAAGAGVPHHIVVVLDSTASMGQGTDTDCSSGYAGSYTPEQCAQMGVQSLLALMQPGTTTPIDEVALMTFPGLCNLSSGCPSSTGTVPSYPSVANYASDDTSCPATDPGTTGYNNNPAYLIVGFPGGNTGTLTPGNYLNPGTGGLNAGSTLVDAIGAGQVTNGGTCSGLLTPGGQRTFYAGALIAAQQYLTENHTAHVQDDIIFLSDGDANSPAPSPSSSPSDMGGSVSQTVSVAGMNGYLFSSTDECTQAVSAADWAKGAVNSDGTATKIYSVAYGSESSGCSGDSYTPCTTMQNISSGAGYFFSVDQSVNGTASVECSGAVSGISDMESVFTYIGGQITGSRLIPNSVF